MRFRVRRQTLIGDIRWADPYGDNWGWLSEATIHQTPEITGINQTERLAEQ